MSNGAKRSAGWAAAFVMTLWTASPVAWACPVCFAAKDEAQRVAFSFSTMFLTALPLLLIGGFISWIARRARTLDADTAAQGQPPQHRSSAAVTPAPGALPLGSSNPRRV